MQGLPVRVQSDNAMTMTMGGTRSCAAQEEVDLILSWAFCPATHIPGVENWQADVLSHQGLVPPFRGVLGTLQRWGMLDVGL